MDAELYDIVACWILLTYKIDKFETSPYLYILGPKASGKTRILEVLQHLAYKAILAASMTPATIFRAIEAWHPTLLLDEAEIYTRESRYEVQALLNSGYKRGQKVMRVEFNKADKAILSSYDVYGPKAIAGTRELSDTLQSRSILIYMEKATRKVAFLIDKEHGQILRSKLRYYKDLDDYQREVDMDQERIKSLATHHRIQYFS